MTTKRGSSEGDRAAILPHMPVWVISPLHVLPHFPSSTFSKCEGGGRGLREGVGFVTSEDSIGFQARQRLETACADDVVVAIVDEITHNARTGSSGGRIVAASDVSNVVRIRTGETDPRRV